MSYERPFLQANYESLHLNFRHARQLLEQELKSLRAELAHAPEPLSEEQSAALRARLGSLQRKIETCHENHKRYARTLTARAESVVAMNDMLAQQDLPRAAQSLVSTLAAAYLADSGQFPRTVRALLEREPQLADLVDWDVIAEENELVDAVVHRRNYDRGLRWCRQHRAFLAKHGIDLEFQLQMLHYRHMLVDNGDIAGAIAYARKAFAKAGPTKDSVLLLAAGALYGPVRVRAREPPVLSDPLDNDGQADGSVINSSAALERAIRAAFSSVHGRGMPYMLLSRVGIGLAALKTRQCGKLPQQPGFEDCPACRPEIEAIAQQVPYAMHTNSILDEDVCALPNHHVIGHERLREYTREAWPAQAAKGEVVDPETGEVFDEDELTPVYAL